MKRKKREIIHQDIQDKVFKQIKSTDLLASKSKYQTDVIEHFLETEKKLKEQNQEFFIQVSGNGSKKIKHYLDQVKQIMSKTQEKVVLMFEAKETTINKMISLVENIKRIYEEHKEIEQKNHILMKEGKEDNYMQIILIIQSQE